MAKYQTVWRRIQAHLVDAVVLSPLFLIDMILEAMGRDISASTYLLWNLFASSFAVLYFVVCHATPAKPSANGGTTSGWWTTARKRRSVGVKR